MAKLLDKYPQIKPTKARINPSSMIKPNKLEGVPPSTLNKESSYFLCFKELSRLTNMLIPDTMAINKAIN